MTCACPSIDLRSFMQRKARILQRARSLYNEAVTSNTLFVDVVYRVLYRNSSENVSLSLIRAQHETVQMCFNNLNPDLDHVPSSGSYAFSSVVGNPDVVFNPVDASAITEDSGQIERIEVDGGVSFGGLNPLQSILDYLASRSDVEQIIPGKLNIYVAGLENNILGQARLESNICCCLSGTIGGYSEQAEFPSYRLGKTTVHEIGHCLGLPHPFNVGSCSIQPFTDVPKSKEPNFEGTLFETMGEWNGALDNRQRDCKFYKDGNSSFLKPGQSPPYSCFDCDVTTVNCTECDTDLYEQFMNFMDYATDENAVMFSIQQSQFMRSWLLSGQTELVLTVASGSTIIPTVPLPSPIADGGDPLPVYATVLISMVALLVLALAAGALLRASGF